MKIDRSLHPTFREWIVGGEAAREGGAPRSCDKSEGEGGRWPRLRWRDDSVKNITSCEHVGRGFKRSEYRGRDRQ